MKHILIPYSFLLVFLSFTVSAQTNGKEQPMEIHCKHFFKGYPLGTPKSNDLIIRDIYALSNNDKTKFADWVAYRITANEVMGDLDLEREWRTDPWLEEDETLEASPTEKDDFKSAGLKMKMDRGHQAPLAHFKGTRFASQANYLSNITPQKNELNQGVWKDLESKERELCIQFKTIYVMTGPLYEKTMPKLLNADEEHTIPSGYWKIIIVPENEKETNFNVTAFIFEQDTPKIKNNSLLKFIVSIDEIEKRSGLDFFWMLEANQEKPLEKNINMAWAEKMFK